MAAESEQPEWNLPEPVWQEEDLGRAIPDTPHACSVAMPLWEHNVGYEEGDERIISQFNAGYPRFFMNPLVAQLRAEIAKRYNLNATQTLLAPTQGAARRVAEYVDFRTGSKAEILQTPQGVWCVHTDETGSVALREFWQHAGEIVSSRTAARCLDGNSQSISATDSKRVLRERIAELQHVEPGDVYLYPSGMAAIYAAWRVTHDSRKCLQQGFPYVDTLKILERFGSVEPLLHLADHVASPDFSDLVAREDVSAVFCELPGNPLLSVPDIPTLRTLADKHSFALVVDDTLGAMINTDVTPFADLIATSLTKFFSGWNDLLAGSLIVVPGQPRYDELKAKLDADFEDMFADDDADVLANNSTNVVRRVEQINASALALANALRKHPGVEHVFFPDEHGSLFDNVRDSSFNSGYGGLLSVVLKSAKATTARVYDALAVSKGPSLGTNFTLCCPYTILAHYEELEFVESCGVSRYLLRISVGLEDPDWIIDHVLKAISSAS